MVERLMPTQCVPATVHTKQWCFQGYPESTLGRGFPVVTRQLREADPQNFDNEIPTKRQWIKENKRTILDVSSGPSMSLVNQANQKQIPAPCGRAKPPRRPEVSQNTQYHTRSCDSSSIPSGCNPRTPKQVGVEKRNQNKPKAIPAYAVHALASSAPASHAGP